ncbi:MAG: hypothetical protein QGI54_10335 [Gammaproteobacteria bacterium]|jgi:FtsZ-interacting cell division protein ZipA|nr:hypothetical protein [Gammaproteobacteria bacterium]
MPRRASDSNPDGKRPCAFCRTLRVVIVFALLIVALMAYSNNLTWLEDIQFTDIFAYVILLAFVIVLVFKVWEEYWKPKQHAEDRDERREEMEKLFDEMDAAVAKREAEQEAKLRSAGVEADEVSITHQAEAAELAAAGGDNSAAADISIEVEEVPPVEANTKTKGDQASPEQLDIFGFDIKRK